MVNVSRMEAQLTLHEGFRAEPYEDTRGFWTVGIGYNLSARGVDDLNHVLGTKFVQSSDHEAPFAGVVLTLAQAQQVLAFDIDRVQRATELHWQDYVNLDEVRQRVVLDLVFNMGFEALTFVKTRAAVEARNWSQAVRELYNSKWAQQVGYGRAHRLGQMLLTGNDYTS